MAIWLPAHHQLRPFTTFRVSPKTGQSQCNINMTYLKYDSLKGKHTKNNPEMEENTISFHSTGPGLTVPPLSSWSSWNVTVLNSLIKSPALSDIVLIWTKGLWFLLFPQCLAEAPIHRKHPANICGTGLCLINIANPKEGNVLPRSCPGCWNKVQRGAFRSFAELTLPTQLPLRRPFNIFYFFTEYMLFLLTHNKSKSKHFAFKKKGPGRLYKVQFKVWPSALATSGGSCNPEKKRQVRLLKGFCREMGIFRWEMQIDGHIYKSKVNFKDARSPLAYKIPREK